MRRCRDGASCPVPLAVPDIRQRVDPRRVDRDAAGRPGGESRARSRTKPPVRGPPAATEGRRVVLMPRGCGDGRFGQRLDSRGGDRHEYVCDALWRWRNGRRAPRALGRGPFQKRGDRELVSRLTLSRRALDARLRGRLDHAVIRGRHRAVRRARGHPGPSATVCLALGRTLQTRAKGRAACLAGQAIPIWCGGPKTRNRGPTLCEL